MEVFVPDYLCPKNFQGKYPYGSNLEDGDNGYIVPISVWEKIFKIKTVILDVPLGLTSSRSVSLQELSSS